MIQEKQSSCLNTKLHETNVDEGDAGKMEFRDFCLPSWYQGFQTNHAKHTIFCTSKSWINFLMAH